MSCLKSLSINFGHKRRTSSSNSSVRPPSSCDFPPSYPQPLSTIISASDVHPQLQSPLFAKLYPELRNIIFTYALTKYTDRTRPYSQHEHFHCPGFEFAGKIDTNLLLTCRLVYLETHLTPISLNEHVFWPRNGPPGCPRVPYWYFRRMTPQQCAAVRRIRYFTWDLWMSMAWTAPGLMVRKITITVRHSDWSHWEGGVALGIQAPQRGWQGRWFERFQTLQELELMFEAMEQKREELEERVRVALKWEFPFKDGTSLVHDGKEPIESRWLGTSRFAPDRNGAPWGSAERSRPLDLELVVKKFKFVQKRFCNTNARGGNAAERAREAGAHRSVFNYEDSEYSGGMHILPGDTALGKSPYSSAAAAKSREHQVAYGLNTKFSAKRQSEHANDLPVDFHSQYFEFKLEFRPDDEGNPLTSFSLVSASMAIIFPGLEKDLAEERAAGTGNVHLHTRHRLDQAWISAFKISENHIPSQRPSDKPWWWFPKYCTT
ncbi:hypothetical protein B0H19DRAFT_1291729 [Mycena capillaripes]|nr:hypothetical protein B0H19DRAFT_1291729 [Mycena capillaripes]